MKNFSKKNQSKKEMKDRGLGRSKDKPNLKSTNFSSENNFSRKNKSSNEFKRRNTSNKELKKEEYNYQNYKNNKNFDDWIWGKHSVFSVLTNSKPINRIWCTQEVFSSEKFYILLKEFKSKGVLIEEVSWKRLSQLTFGASHQGIALQLASSEHVSLNKLIELSLRKSKNPIILALDGITDPHNLGAIIRSAEAFDCKGIVIPQRRSAGLTGTVAKVAAGALEYMPISRVVNLNRALDELKKNGFLIIGLSGESQLPISKFKEKSPIIVIIGSEDKGISLLTQKKCDFLLRIPLKGKTSSLNASVAAGISLFHLNNN